ASSVASFMLCASARLARYQSVVFPELGDGAPSSARASQGMNSGVSFLMKSCSARRASCIDELNGPVGLVEIRMKPISVMGHRARILPVRQVFAFEWWTCDGQIRAISVLTSSRWVMGSQPWRAGRPHLLSVGYLPGNS